MRLLSDEKLNNCSEEDLLSYLTKINEYSSNYHNLQKEQLIHSVQRFHLMCLHSGSIIENHSRILISVNVLYNPAVF